MKKKLLCVLLTITVAMSLIACGGTQSAAGDSGAKTEEAAPAAEVKEEAAPAAEADDTVKEPVELTVWFYERENMMNLYESWNEEVNSKYPWITMKFEELPYDSGPEKFTVACATGTTPDILYDGYSRIAPAVHSGLALDITDIMADNASAFISEAKDGIIDGKNYYIPTNDGASYGILVNMDLANKLGVADMLPKDRESWSYDDFLAVLRAAKAADSSIVPCALFAGNQSSDCWYYSWYMANGAQITSDDLTECVVNQGQNKEKISETLGVFGTMVNEHLAPDGCATLTDDDAIALWHAGQLLFMAGGLNEIIIYYNNQEAGTSLEFEIDACALPTKAGTAGASGSWGSTGLVGFNNAGHEEAIKAALDVYLKNPKYCQGTCEICGTLPRMNGVTIEYNTEHLNELMTWATDFSAKHNTSAFGILEPWWTDFRGTHYPQLQDFFAGNIDEATMLDNWKAAADEVIKAAE